MVQNQTQGALRAQSAQGKRACVHLARRSPSNVLERFAVVYSYLLIRSKRGIQQNEQVLNHTESAKLTDRVFNSSDRCGYGRADQSYRTRTAPLADKIGNLLARPFAPCLRFSIDTRKSHVRILEIRFFKTSSSEIRFHKVGTLAVGVEQIRSLETGPMCLHINHAGERQICSCEGHLASRISVERCNVCSFEIRPRHLGPRNLHMRDADTPDSHFAGSLQ